jgi:hypothetical protein
MRHFNRRSTQHGTVLVIGLLLLLIITIVAVSSMSSTHMQERMAGNARTQALAFQVASAGASDSMDFYLDHRLEVPLTSCAPPELWTINLGHTATMVPPNIGPHRVRLTQQLYCLQAPIRPQYFVLSTGEVLAGTGIDETTIARRGIEIRIERPGDPDCGALCFLGCDSDNEYRFPTSNAFLVDGDTNPAITTPEECRQEVRDAIRNNRIGNYLGGISGFSEPLPPPWSSTETVNDFRKQLLTTMGASEPDSLEPFRIDQTDLLAGSGPVTTAPGYTWQFIEPPGGGTFTDAGSTQYGTTSNPQITYIAGDADLRGTVSGAGILVVEGNLEWRGTPPFEGLILVLGGQFKVGGGGTGGNFAGSLVVVNIWKDHDPTGLKNQGYYTNWYNKHGTDYLSDEFGKVDLDFRGGGTAFYGYDCDLLEGLSDDLGLSGWNPQCGADDGGALVERIASWRENIGWRVDFVD